MNPTRVKELLLSALERPAPERAGFLDETCAGDPSLRAEVQELLEAHERAEPLFDSGGVRLPGDPLTDLAPGDQIDGYVLEREIGQGGFGAVFLARQEEPVRRRVALKVLKLGMDTRSVIDRFEAERQVLAMMEHPNIAKVLDAGATPLGRPYFVMELALGEPITDYCEKRELRTGERLELFRSVCQAIQHAHQKGVLHRDIKPGNVLVTQVDGQAVPKVIDFGIAKVLEGTPGDWTLLTHAGQFVGTPAYMSPEQAVGTGDVDTRSDVYALGVLLYELVTGVPPFSPEHLRSIGLAEVLREIRDVDPPRPGARLSALRKTPTGETTTVEEVPRDLDWIVMRALEKDRSRRYQTASDLAVEIERFLRHEPVEAAPPSEWYRLRKLLRRHRVASLAVAGLVLTLLVATVGTTMGLFALRREARRARAAESRAAERAEVVENINEFLTRDLLGAVAPSVAPGRGRDVSMREVLDAAAERIDAESEESGRFHGAPLVESAIRSALGEAYSGLGEPAAALPHLERAVELTAASVGPGEVETLGARVALGRALWLLARYEEAEALARRTGDELEELVGPDHPETIEARMTLGIAVQRQGRFAESKEIYADAYARAREALGDGSRLTLMTLANLAIAHDRLGEVERALELNERLLAIHTEKHGAEHPLTLAALSNLAAFHLSRNGFQEAESLLREAVERSERVMGPDHYQTVSARHNLVIALIGLERLEEAGPMLAETLERVVRGQGEDHANTLKLRLTRARLQMAQERYPQAEETLRSVIESSRSTLGPRHPATLSRIKDLANALYMQGRVDEAEAELLEVLETQLEVLGPAHPSTIRTRSSLGICALELGRPEDAEGHYAAALPDARDVLGEDDPITMRMLRSLARAYAQASRWKEAEPLARAVVESLRRTGGDDASLGDASLRLGESLVALGRLEEAEERLTEAHAALERAGSDRKQDACAAIAALYHRRGETERAATWEERSEQ